MKPNKFNKAFNILFVVMLVSLIVATPVFAQTYSADILLAETSGNAYDMLGLRQQLGVTNLVDRNYISALGLDTRVMEGGTALPHMLADDKVTFANNLPANSSQTLQFTVGNTVNLLWNSDFEVGDPPTGWTSEGTPDTFERSTDQVKIGTYSLKIIRDNGNCGGYQAVANYARYAGRKVTFGCWVWSDTASRARLRVPDGVGSTESGLHPGGSAWVWMTVTHTVDDSPTILYGQLQIRAGAATTYWDGATLVEGTVIPDGYVSNPLNLPKYPIITGYDGYLTVNDVENLELGNNFEVEIDGYFDTTATGQYIVEKDGGFYIGVGASNEDITATIYNYIDPIDVSPGVFGSWQDVDVSAYCPAGTTGVVLRLVANGKKLNVRKKGSGDNRINAVGTYHYGTMVGVDGNRKFQAYLQNNACFVYLAGYVSTGYTFKTNADDISLAAGFGAWTEIDLTANTSANTIGVIIEVEDVGGAPETMGFRKNGSTDARTTTMVQTSTSWVIIGCDSSQKIRHWAQTTNINAYLVGYIENTSDAVFATNATDKSLAGIGAYADIDCSAEAPNADFLVFEITSTGNFSYALREKGSGLDLYEVCGFHGWNIVKCDKNQVVEGKISNVGVDFFLVGYITGGVDLPGVVEVTVSGVDSDEHIVKARADATVMELLVDIENLIFNSDFEVGDPPASWAVVGAGATFSRSNTQVKLGSYSGKLVGDGTDTVYQNMVANFSYYAGRKVTLGCWVWASEADEIKIYVYDGVDSTDSDPHSGGSGWEWLTVTRIMDGTPTALQAAIKMYAVATTIYFDGAILVEGDSCPITPPVPVTEALGGNSVPANDNDYIIGQNNVLPYINTMTIDVGGVEILEFLPDTIINACIDRARETADGGSTTTLEDAVLTEDDDYWNSYILEIMTTTDGLAPQGEIKTVTDFDAANDRLYFTAMTATVQAGDTYELRSFVIVDETPDSYTADSGTISTLVDAALTEVDDYWNGATLYITTTTDGLAPQGEYTIIDDFTQADDTLHFTPFPLGVAPGAGDTYDLRNDGHITWGNNPSGVTCSIGSLMPTDDAVVAEGLSSPDVAGEIAEPDTMFPEDTALEGTGLAWLYPTVRDTMALTNTPIFLAWCFLAVVFVLICMAATYKYTRHLALMGLMGCVAIGLCVGMSFLPLWMMLVAVVVVGGLSVAERSPSM